MMALMNAPKSMPLAVPATGMVRPAIVGAVAARDELDERVDDVVGQRRDDGRERCADDDADGHIDHVAAVDELFELGQEAFHGRSLLT